MKCRTLSLLAAAAFCSTLSLVPVAATAQESQLVKPHASVTTPIAAESLPATDVLHRDAHFDQDELAALAALEAANAALEHQTAGFFGPRIGTIIIIGLVLILVL